MRTYTTLIFIRSSHLVLGVTIVVFCVQFSNAELCLVCCVGEEAHLNTCFKHFYYFISEFDLVDKREVSKFVLLHECYVLILFLVACTTGRIDRKSNKERCKIQRNNAGCCYDNNTSKIKVVAMSRRK
jgi:hypothetical protein